MIEDVHPRAPVPTKGQGAKIGIHVAVLHRVSVERTRTETTTVLIAACTGTETKEVLVDLLLIPAVVEIASKLRWFLAHAGGESGYF
jgi:hypothetical protein